MLYLYCLIWFKKILSFFDLWKKIVDKNEFKTWLISFLGQVIKCELILVDIDKVLSEVRPSATIIGKDKASFFALQLKDNVNLVIS